MHIGLSAKGLARRMPNLYDNDFTFLVGAEEYVCPTYIATFLSPRIHGILASDPTVRHFVIATNDPFGDFKRFLDLGEGLDLTMTKPNLGFYRSICLELWNRELFNSLFGASGDYLSCQNVADRLAFLVKTDEPYDTEIAFCAAHFFEIDLGRLAELDLPVIWSILAHPDLKLSNEDSLYDFVRGLCKTDMIHASLFECIRFDYLSSESINSFIEIVDSSFDILTFPVWAAVSARIALSALPRAPNDRLVYSLCTQQDCKGHTETTLFHVDSEISSDSNSLELEFNSSSTGSSSSMSP
jgi:hypothetical protein